MPAAEDIAPAIEDKKPEFQHLKDFIYETNRYKELIDPVPFARSKDEIYAKEEIYREIAKEMNRFMEVNFYHAAGINALQFGVRERIFAYRNDTDKKVYIAIEPQVPEFDLHKSAILGREGCLSFPGMVFFIKRPKKIIAKHYTFNMKGQMVMAPQMLKDINARRYLHELDHSEGLVLPLKAINLSGPGNKPLADPNIPTVKLGNINQKYIFKIPWGEGELGQPLYDYYIEDSNVTFFSNEKINPEGFLTTRILIGHTI